MRSMMQQQQVYLLCSVEEFGPSLSSVDESYRTRSDDRAIAADGS